MPAVVTPCPGKAARKDSAFQIFAKGLAHKGLWRVVVSRAVKLARAGQLKTGRNARQWFGTAACVRGGGGCRAWVWLLLLVGLQQALGGPLGGANGVCRVTALWRCASCNALLGIALKAILWLSKGYPFSSTRHIIQL